VVPLASARDSYEMHCNQVRWLHTMPAHEVSLLTPPNARIAVEAAGSIRYVAGARVIIDLLGLNNRTVAHVGKDDFLGACLPLLRSPEFIVVPSEWLSALSAGYEIDIKRQYHAYTNAENQTRKRTYVFAGVRVRPEMRAMCEQYVRSLTYPLR